MESFDHLRQHEDAVQRLLEQEGDGALTRKTRERLLCLLHALDCGNVSLTCERYGISRQTFYAWVKRFNPEDPSSLDDRPSVPKTVRQRAVPTEVLEVIRTSRERLMTKEQISTLLAERGTPLSASTVGRIVREHGLFFGTTPSQVRKQSRDSVRKTLEDAPGSWAAVLMLSAAALTLVGGGLLAPSSAHAAQGSSYILYGDFDRYSNKDPLSGSVFDAVEAGTTDMAPAARGSQFQITDTPPAAAASTSSASSSSAESSVQNDAPDEESSHVANGGGRRPSSVGASSHAPASRSSHPAAPSSVSSASFFASGASVAGIVPIAPPDGFMTPLPAAVIDHPAAPVAPRDVRDAVDVIRFCATHQTALTIVLWIILAFLLGFGAGSRLGRTMPLRRRTKKARVPAWVAQVCIACAIALAALIVSFWFVPVAFSASTTPLTHTYHGHLLDASGNAVTTAHTIRFSYWKSSDFVAGDLTAGAINTGATHYVGWYEEQTVTPDSRGYFSVQLGASTPLPSMSALAASTLQSLFLQVEVKVSGAADTTYDLLDTNPGDATADRTHVLSVPFAANADLLDQRDVGTGSGAIPVLQSGGLLPFSMIPSGTNASSFVLDADGASASGALVFGGTLAEYLRFNTIVGRFEFSDDVYVPGDLAITGTASGSRVHAEQRLTSSGTLIVEGPVEFGSTLTLNGVTYAFPVGDGAASGRVLMTNGAGQLSWGLIGTGTLQTRTRTLNISADASAITTDGTSNDANVFIGSETGATVNPHQYYRIATGSGQLQDIDIRFKVLLPADFVSFANTGDLSFFYRTTGSASTQSKLDILVEDADGDDAFPAVDGQALFNTSWTQYADEFDGASFNPVAGQYVFITIKGYASSGGSAFAGELNLTYTSR